MGVSGDRGCRVSGFSQAAFAAAVAAVITARDVSDRQTAREAGVAPSTLTRCVRQGKNPDVDTLARLCDWAGLSLDAFVVRQRPIPETPFVADQRRMVAAMQSADAAARALSLMLGGDR